MKKIFLIYFICVVGIFFLPVLFVKQHSCINLAEKRDITKIKLLLSQSNEIIEIDLDEYIMGVLVGEMPVNYNLEALKAQAIVARTYTLNKMTNSEKSHENADMCDDINHCQAYKTKEYALSCWNDKEKLEKWNKIKKAVLDTSEIVITYNNSLINAFFHANSGGRTEDISNIWGHEKIPYLKSVESNEIDNIIEKVSFTYDDINEIMEEKYSKYIPMSYQSNIRQSESTKKNTKIIQNEDSVNENIKILEVNSSGRISKMQISNITLEGTEVRSMLGLRSTLFTINFENENIIFETKGYGHGIGMSQYGANDMANNGYNYEEIIKHYYTDVELVKYK